MPPPRVAFILACLTTSSLVLAGDPPRPIEPAKLAGQAAFEWSHGKKCKRVDAALIKKWTAAYSCMPPESSTTTASGKPNVAVCTARKGRSEFLVFATMVDCKTEYDTQMANGE